MHIFGQTPHHYVPMKSFFDKVGGGADYSQEYWVWQPEDIQQKGFTNYTNGKVLLNKMCNEPVTTRFIFHGLFDRSILPRLAFSSLLKRSAWVCWGADLHQHKQTSLTFKRKVMFYLHRVLTFRMKTVCSLNAGDGDLIRNWLWHRDVEVLPYPLIADDMPIAEKPQDAPVSVLVGNSANPTNNHMEILTKLSRFKDENMIVNVPLNYAGPEEYVERVVSHGKDILGDKFQPITHLLDKAEYDSLLADTDVAVFFQQRQQGLYVVYSMLKYGRKMYLRSETSSFEEMNALGFKVHPTEEIAELSFEQFVHQADDAKEENQHLMHHVFSQKALMPKWSAMLSAL